MHKYTWLLLLLLFGACGGGGSSNNTTPPKRGDYVSASSAGSYTIEEIDNRKPAEFAAAQHGVTVYKIIYKSADSAGDIINASGLLAIPANSTAPMLVYHHGTIYQDGHAPSTNSDFAYYAAYMASQGFIVLMPDYLGYGESSALLHPYLYANSYSTATIDLLRAAKAYLGQQNITAENKLFLTGYSEGGYATLAVHREIEKDFPNEFTVTASIPAAGAYDLSTTLDSYLLGTNLENLPGLVFAFVAYDNVYAMNRLTEIFNPPYHALVKTAFNGTTAEGQIKDQLSGVSQISELFSDTFLANYQLADGELIFKNRVANNNVYDWKPVAPIRLFHGEHDTITAFQNTITARDAMLDRAVDNDVDVMIESCTATSNAHLACVNPYTIYMLATFATF